MPKLRIKQGDNEESKELVGDLTTIGRIEDNTIQLKDIKISRQHCQITKTPEGYKIIDLDSSNGTLVNETRITEQLLQDKDLIKLGDIEITFLTEAEISPEIPVPEPIVEFSEPEVPEVISDAEERQTTKARRSVHPKSQLHSEPISEPSVSQEPSPKPEPSQPSVPTPVPVSEPEFTTPKGVDQLSYEKTVRITPPTRKPETPPTSKFSKLKSLPKTERHPDSKRRDPSGKGKRMAQIGTQKPGATKFSKAARWKKMTQPDETEAEAETEKERPKSRSQIIFFIMAGLVLLGIVVGMIFVLKPLPEPLQETSLAEQQELISQAEELAQQGNYQVAIKKYQEFLAQYADSKYAEEVQTAIEALEKRLTEREAAQKWPTLKQKIEDTKIDEFPSLLKEFQSFMATYPDTPEAKEAEGEIMRIKRIIASSSPANEDFNILHAQIDRALIPNKDFDAALREWNNFLKKYPQMSDPLRHKVQSEIKHITELKQTQK